VEVGKMPAFSALRQPKQTIHPPAKATLWQTNIKEIQTMFKRKILTPIFALFLIGMFIASPTMRATASEFLGYFRVSKFAAVTISPQQMALLEDVMESGINPGTFEMTDDPGRPELVDNLREATIATGFTAKEVQIFGEADRIYTANGGSGRMTIDLEGVREILKATNVDPNSIPESVDGKDVNVTIYANITQEWDNGYNFFQMESPLVQYPDGIDPVVMGTALLQVLGLDAEEATRLANTIDWTSTLLVPIPQGVANYEEVTINGNSGLAVSNPDGKESAVIWQADGVLYPLAGENATIKELTRIAGSVQ
ncbi:MAG: hypothetical protein KAG66_16865, partial [Methylococcales bacterium]|nr:hypothetical protein [Methylococcales bacterium]